MLHPIFPTQIGCFKYEGHASVKDKLLDLTKSAVGGANENSPTLIHYGQEEGNRGLDLSVVEDFKSWVCARVEEYVRFGMGLHIDSSIIPINSWLNVGGAGSHQFPHSHANCLACATYYVNFNPEVHSRIYFINPARLPTDPYLQFPFNEHHANRVDVGLEEGVLVIWPGHLMHGVDTNIGSERVSLSMNFLPEVVMGQTYGFKVVPLD